MQSQPITSNTLNHVATRFVNSENVSRFREGTVYAVVFSDGWLKVGRGRNPQSRISSHACVSGMRNATVDRSVISGTVADSLAAEAALISFCSEQGEAVHGREWFTGVSFDTVCKFIEEQFSGDSPEYLSEARKFQSDRVQSMLDGVFSRAQPVADAAAMNEAEERLKWISSLAYARILDRLYRDDMYDGWLFEVSESGITNFGNYAALTVHALDEGEIADLFYRVSTNPGEALDQIVSSARAMVDAFSAGEYS